MISLMWIILSLINALGLSFESVLQKKSTLHVGEALIVWSILAVTSVFYLPLLVVSLAHGPVRLDGVFWAAIIGRLLVDSAALLLYIKALKYTHLSLAIPMLSLSPVFLVGVSLLVNHLFPSPLGLVGVLVVVIGVYFLNFDHDTRHLLSPFFAIKRDKGVQYMLLAAFLWAWVTAFQKLGIDHSNATFYTAFFQPIWAITFLPIAYFSSRREFSTIFRWQKLRLLVPIGILDIIQTISQNLAFVLALPVYVSAVGSTNLLFASFLGRYFFQEKIRNKLAPTLIIVGGIVLLAVAQA